MTQALFPQIKPLSSKPTPAELAEFSRAVRAALNVLQAVPAQLAALDKTVATTVAGAIKDLTEVIEAPTTLTGFTVTGLFAKIMAEWDEPGYEGHAYTEIWRAQVDDLGLAVLIDKAPYLLWVDENLPNNSLGESYYYWGRHVNKNGDAGAFNAVEGTLGRTADDPDYLLEIAAEKWLAGHDYALGALTMPTIPNGYCYEVTVDGGSSGLTEPLWPIVIDDTVTDGDLTWKCKSAFSFEQFFKIALVDGVPRLTLKDLYLADGIIKRAMVGLLAVDDARMESCSVSKLLAGIIEAAGIYVGASGRIHIDGANERITVSDGTRVRATFGKIGADWGLQVVDAAGNVTINATGALSLSAIAGLGSLSTLNGFTLANINTYFETAAIGTGLINDAAVTTLKIGANAVTVPVGAYTAGNIAIGTSWVTVQQATIGALGQPISIDFASAYYISWSSSTEYVTGELYCRLVYSTGAEIIPEYMVERQFGPSSATLRGTVSFSTMIFPAGSVTVYLQLRINTTSYLTQYKNAFCRYLGLIGMKR